ncbi:MAG: alkaline phosphatase [Candidatus Binatia bacterium]
MPLGAVVLACLTVIWNLASAAPAPESAQHLTHGPAAGEIGSGQAVLWGRCDGPGTLQVELLKSQRHAAVEVEAERDYTGRVALRGLAPDTAYAYRMWCASGHTTSSEVASTGSFRTAPADDRPRPVRVVWGGDLGGQNVCRDRRQGYPIFATMSARRPDLFVALGDMIYADDVCRDFGRYGNAQLPGPSAARDRAGYWAHWRYNREDTHARALLAQVPMIPVWDDHETRDDAGPSDDAPPDDPGAHLMPAALDAFLDYQPLLPPADAPTRVYRRVRWGRHLELFALDTRQYREPNTAPDSESAPKSMLGAAQRTWLEQSLAASDATWKIIISSVPLAIPTGAAARDGFASGDSTGGFEREAAALFAALRAHGIRNHLWITTDVHFATALLYRPVRADPAWISREIITGPLNAGVFPNRRLDSTFRPQRLFFYAPETADAIASFDTAQEWFNFGELDVSADGRFTVRIINGRGRVVYELALVPSDR